MSALSPFSIDDTQMILVKLPEGMEIPVVLTSSQEANVAVQGPLMPGVEEILPAAFAARSERPGVVNAWDAPACAEVWRSAGRNG